MLDFVLVCITFLTGIREQVVLLVLSFGCLVTVNVL